MSFCTNCGKKLAPGEERCPICAQIAAVDEAMEERPTAIIEHSNCRNCGSEMQYDPHSKLFTCHYCGTTKETLFTPGDIQERPPMYIPFDIVLPKAESIVENFLGLNKPYNASKRRSVKNLTIKQYYLPFWLFSLEAESRYTIKFSWPISSALSDFNQAAAELLVRDYPHSAYPAFKDKLLDHTRYLYVLPYDFSLAEPLVPGALGDVPVEPLVVSLADARAKTVEYIERKQREIGNERLDNREREVADMETTCRNWTAGKVFAPVWEATYTIGRTPYRLLINGQTGQINGVDPKFHQSLNMLIVTLVVLVPFAVMLIYFLYSC